MANTPTHTTIQTREPWPLRLLNRFPVLAWLLLTALVGVMAGWIVGAW
jgi:hypothetical protein